MNPQDAVSAALEFYRAPARHHELLHGRAPLPAGVDRLLRLAGGASPQEADIPAGAYRRADELAAAARFFVEQVLLAHNADHYRLLGVNRDAPLEQIKEHHRLLMRMFHPDRDSGFDPDVKAACASRINLAYNALRQSDTRTAYDTQLRQASRQAAVARPVRQGAYVRREAPAAGAPRLPPALTRNLPQFVLGGIALVAAVAVASVYLDRPPEGAIGWEPGEARLQVAAAPNVTPPHPAPQPLSEPAPAVADAATATDTATAAAVPDTQAPAISALAASRLVVAAPPAPAKAAPPAALPVAPKPPATPATAAPGPAAVTSVAPTRLAQASGNRTAIATPPQPAPAPSRAPAANPPRAAASQATPPAAPTPPVQPAQPSAAVEAPAVATLAVAAPAPAPVSAPPPSGLAEADLVKLVARISRHYAGGDLEAFMAMFDDAARSEAGGKTQIRSDYETLFRNTQQRNIVIWDMSWQHNGDQARGEGSFQARVVRNGEAVPRTYTGHISIEAVRRGDNTLIRTFNHTLKR